MSTEVGLPPEAEQDLLEAATWYEANQPRLGSQFLDEVEVTPTSIGEQPFAHTVVHRSTRRALVRRFPVGVFYLVDDAGGVVVAVMHASRNPRSWKQRT